MIGNIKRKGQNQYEIGYEPTVKGQHQFHIKVEGQHITGKSIFCSSEVTSGEAWPFNPNYRQGGGTLWSSSKPEGGGTGN